MSKTYKQRDKYIKKHTEHELDLSTKVVPSKKAYTRKEKYKPTDY